MSPSGATRKRSWNARERVLARRAPSPARGRAARRLPLGHEREHPAGAPGPAHQLQRRDDEQRAGDRQPVEVGQLREPEPARRRAGSCAAGMAGPSRRPSRRRSRPSRCRSRRSRARWPATATPRRPGRAYRSVLADVQELILVVGARLPAGAQQHPGAVGNAAVLGLPRLEVGDGQQVAVAAASVSAVFSITHAGPTSVSGSIEPMSSPSLPVTQWIGASTWVPDVLADRQRVPGPGRAAVVVLADLLAAEAGGVGERRRQLDHRRRLGQRLGQVDDLDRARGEPVDKRGDLADLSWVLDMSGSLLVGARGCSSAQPCAEGLGEPVGADRRG